MRQKSIKKNTIYNAVKTCSSIIFPLITFPYISRVLMPENVGKVNFATTYIGYFSLIATLGITTYAVRECAAVREDRNKLGKITSQIYSINIITTIIAYILLVASLFLFRNLDSYRTLIIISSTTLIFTTLGADWLNTAMEDFGYITLRTVAFQILSLIAIFIFVRAEDDYIKYAIISVVAGSGANIMNIYYRRRYCKVSLTFDIDWKKHMTPIMLLFAMMLSQQILKNTDVTMLGLMRSDTEVGYYSTAVKITNLVSQVVFSILWVLLPRLSEYSLNGNIEERNKLLRKALCFLVGLGLPCVVGMAIVAEDVILLIGGEAYLPATGALIILMGEFFFGIFGGSFIGNLIMLTSRQEKWYFLACCESAIANLIFNYIFIPKYGIYAAATATVVASVVMLISLLIHMDKTIRFEKPLNIVLAPIIGCGIIAVLAFLLEKAEMVYWLELIVTVIVCGIAYATVLLIMKYELLVNLMEQLKSRLRR